jgi:hypothetical protein
MGQPPKDPHDDDDENEQDEEDNDEDDEPAVIRDRTNKKSPIKLEVGGQVIEPNHAVCVTSTRPRADTNMMSAHSLSLSSNRRMLEIAVIVFNLYVAIVGPVPLIDDFNDIDSAPVPIMTSSRHAYIA